MAASPEEIEKKIRAVRKKLGQIEKLREKDPKSLDAAAKEKVASEPTLRAELATLEEQLSGGSAAAKPEAPVETAKVQNSANAAGSKAKAKPAAPEQPAAKAPAKPVASAQPAVKEPTPASVAAPAEGGVPDERQEKRIKAIKKKLQQIARLKERDTLDADAKSKVAGEAELISELAALERGEEFTPSAGNDNEEMPEPQTVTETNGAAEAEPAVDKDPHAQERSEALEPPPGDLGLLIDDETEKRFKSLQKKLRDIGKLREKDKLDKLQQEKLLHEVSLIEELAAIREKAKELVAKRREQMAAAPKKVEKSEVQAKKEKPPPNPNRPEWLCNECGACGKVKDLIGSEGAVACPKCGGISLTHYAPRVDDDEDEEDGEEPTQDAREGKKHNSSDLKTARQKKQPPAAKKDDGVIPSPSSAKWPEVREVLESAGDDKGKYKKTIEVRRGKEGAPYNVFDATLLKCSFLTRVELKLPPGALNGEDFNLYFPGGLAESLVDLILKENQLPIVPPGIQHLQRLRSLDLSGNQIESLPSEETWEGICGTVEMLDLSFNKLTSIEELASLRKLSQLKVDANQLTSLKGVSWGELKQIVTLSAVGNQLTELSPDIEKAPSLEYVELSENKLTVLPTSVSELKKLKAFNIAGNPIKDPKVMKAAEKGVKDLKTYLSKIGSKGKK